MSEECFIRNVTVLDAPVVSGFVMGGGLLSSDMYEIEPRVELVEQLQKELDGVSEETLRFWVNDECSKRNMELLVEERHSLRGTVCRNREWLFFSAGDTGQVLFAAQEVGGRMLPIHSFQSRILQIECNSELVMARTHNEMLLIELHGRAKRPTIPERPLEDLDVEEVGDLLVDEDHEARIARELGDEYEIFVSEESDSEEREKVEPMAVDEDNDDAHFPASLRKRFYLPDLEKDGYVGGESFVWASVGLDQIARCAVEVVALLKSGLCVVIDVQGTIARVFEFRGASQVVYFGHSRRFACLSDDGVHVIDVSQMNNDREPVAIFRARRDREAFLQLQVHPTKSFVLFLASNMFLYMLDSRIPGVTVLHRKIPNFFVPRMMRYVVETESVLLASCEGIIVCHDLEFRYDSVVWKGLEVVSNSFVREANLPNLTLSGCWWNEASKTLLLSSSHGDLREMSLRGSDSNLPSLMRASLVRRALSVKNCASEGEGRTAAVSWMQLQPVEEEAEHRRSGLLAKITRNATVPIVSEAGQEMIERMKAAW